jgi:fermentation-respiration switch protein FrsA (DUF1100 family)
MRRAARNLLLLFLVSVLTLTFGCRRAIYPFQDGPSQPVGIPRTEAKWLPARDGHPELEVWVAEPQGNKPVLIFFMGNAGNLAYSSPRIEEFVGQGYGFAGMTYRGGGGRPGEPSERALKADALRMYTDLNELFVESIPESRRILYGSSLGTGIATDLATRVNERAVILETPYTQLCDIAELRYERIPTCTLMRNERYDNISLIARIGSPLLIQHGERDEIVPFELGRRLFEAASEPKKLIAYPRGNHNNLLRLGAGGDAIRFLESL